MGVSLFRQSLVIHAEQMEHGGVEIVYTHSIRFGFVAEVTRPPMPWKMPGLAVEEVDVLTSAPTFQTRSRSGVPHRSRRRALKADLCERLHSSVDWRTWDSEKSPAEARRRREERDSI